MMLKDVALRTKRGLSMYKVYGDSTLLVLNGTPLNSVNAILALSQQIYPLLKSQLIIVAQSEIT